MSDGSAEKQVMWSRALGKLLLLALSEAPDSVSVALRHVVARLPAIQSAIDSHKVWENLIRVCPIHTNKQTNKTKREPQRDLM